ncbi:Hypothetical predicted protein, partial [Paramuricea clavata]
MSDLPEDRIDPSSPFSYCAVDFFGPFTIKEKRSLRNMSVGDISDGDLDRQ